MAVSEVAQTGQEGGRLAARWSRMAALALLLMALAPTMMVAAAVISGMDTEDLGFFVVVAAVLYVGSLLVWRFGTWSKFVGILAALAGAATMFWTAFGLPYVSSVFDFVPGILVIPGAILAIASCVAAIVAGRRGHLTARATGGEAKALRIALAVLAVAAVVSGALTFTGRSSVDAGTGTEVVAKNFEFEDSYTVEGGGRLVASNEDAFLHTVTIDALGIDVALSPGKTVAVDVPDRPGTYVLYCKPHTANAQEPEGDDMASELRVT